MGKQNGKVSSKPCQCWISEFLVDLRNGKTGVTFGKVDDENGKMAKKWESWELFAFRILKT